MILEGMESNRLYFKNLVDEDFDDYMPFFSDPQAMKFYYLNDKPEVICKNWIAGQQKRYEKDGYGLYALREKESHVVVGQCGLLKQFVDGKEELEVGYGLLPAYWGKGYATEAARRCVKYAFDNNWSEDIISIIDVNNDNSKQVALRNGFSLLKKTTFKNINVNIFGTSKKSWPYR